MKEMNVNEFSGFWVPRHNAKVFKRGLEEWKAPFLPDDMGTIKTEAIYNLATHGCLPANRLIPMQFRAMEMGYKSNLCGTKNVLSTLKFPVKENELGIYYTFKDEMGEIYTNQLFFAEQTEGSEWLIEEASKEMKPISNLQDVSMVIASSNPKEYLGTYIAACRAGMKLSVDPQIAEEFKFNIMPYLENELKEHCDRDLNMDTLEQILFMADKRGTEIIRTLNAEI